MEIVLKDALKDQHGIKLRKDANVKLTGSGTIMNVSRNVLFEVNQMMIMKNVIVKKEIIGLEKNVFQSHNVTITMTGVQKNTSVFVKKNSIRMKINVLRFLNVQTIVLGTLRKRNVFVTKDIMKKMENV